MNGKNTENRPGRRVSKEDAIDLAAFEERSDEPERPFDAVLKDLKRSDQLQSGERHRDGFRHPCHPRDISRRD